MATTKLFNGTSYQGSDNEIVNLEMRSGGDLYWLKPLGGSAKVDGLTADIAATDTTTVLTINITPNGATPYLQSVVGSVLSGNPSSGLSWSYPAGGSIVLKVTIPAVGPVGQDEQYRWEMSAPGAPAVRLTVIVKRIAPAGFFAVGTDVPSDGASIVVTRVEVPPGADPSTVAALMKALVKPQGE